MSTQSIIQQVRWQDLKVKSEVEIVFELAEKEGWKDCEVFGYGDMISQPRESTGWKLIPADLYEGNIPAEGIGRVHRIIDAGVRIQGIIIADDQRRIEISPAPSKPKVLLSVVSKIRSFFGRTLTGLKRVTAGLGRALAELSRVPARFGSALAAGLGRLLVGIGGILIKSISIVVPAALLVLAVYLLIHFPLLMIFPGLIALAGAGTSTGSRVSYDPKLVVLVDDGTGGTVWVSMLTWYD